MTPRFRKKETIQAILYILQKEGGSTDIHRISKILYFADQKHLSKYGRLITGDRYIAMANGPVPSKVYDVFKYLRGDSYFTGVKDDVDGAIVMVNKKFAKAVAMPDMDYLSESDVECLDESIRLCEGMNFGQLTQFSHGLAWTETRRDREMSYKDILREAGDSEEYIEYTVANL